MKMFLLGILTAVISLLWLNSQINQMIALSPPASDTIYMYPLQATDSPGAPASSPQGNKPNLQPAGDYTSLNGRITTN